MAKTVVPRTRHRGPRGPWSAAAAAIATVLAGATLLGFTGGCPFVAPVADPTAGQTDEPSAPVDPATRTVVVWFRNLAVEEAVDVQYYSTNDALDALPETLFVEQNSVSVGIGIAGTGILEPQSEDTLEIPCTDNLVIGTAGGSFLDNETGEIRGAGPPRWVQDITVGLCGRRVLFEFVNEFGTFGTRISVGG